MPVEFIPEWQREIAKKWQRKYNTDRTLDCHDKPVSIWNADGSNRIRFVSQSEALEFCILSAIREVNQRNVAGLAEENKRLKERVEQLKGIIETEMKGLEEMDSTVLQEKTAVNTLTYLHGLYRAYGATLLNMKRLELCPLPTPADPQSGEGGEG